MGVIGKKQCVYLIPIHSPEGEFCLLDKLEIEGDKRLKCYIEEQGSTEYKLFGENEITPTRIQRWQSRKGLIIKAMLKGISPGWEKTTVSDWKGPAKEAIKKPQVDIFS